jgi:hypothetical protein
MVEPDGSSGYARVPAEPLLPHRVTQDGDVVMSRPILLGEEAAAEREPDS